MLVQIPLVDNVADFHTAPLVQDWQVFSYKEGRKGKALLQRKTVTLNVTVVRVINLAECRNKAKIHFNGKEQEGDQQGISSFSI